MKSNRHKSFLLPAIILAFGIVLIQSCVKAPVPAFTIEPSVNPEAGDSIFFLNTSVNAATYEWNFGDGYSSTDIDPTNIYVESGSYDVTLTASNAKKSEMITQSIVINDPTVLAVYTYEDDEETLVGDVSVWVYDSQASYNNNPESPQFEAYTDADGLAMFLNLEAQKYIIDVYKETETGYWWGVYEEIPAMTQNEINAWGLIMLFEQNATKKSLAEKRAYRTQGLKAKSFRK